MRITHTLTAGAVLAVAAACGQQRAAGPAPAAEREFQYIATNQSRTSCTMAYGVKGDSTAVVVGEVPAGGLVSFTVRQPERGADMVLYSSCGDETYTSDLRPRRHAVAVGTGTPRTQAIREVLPRCGGLSRYTPSTPECGIPKPDGGYATPSTRPRGDGGGGGDKPNPPLSPSKDP